MDLTSYFAKQYFPSFYFGSQDSDTSCFLAATLSGSSYISLNLTDANAETVSVMGSWIPLPWHDPNSKPYSKVSLGATLTGSSHAAANLRLSLPMHIVCAGTGRVNSSLTENAAAKIRYKRRKEELAIAHMLLSM